MGGVKTTFVHEDGDSAKIFNEGDDIAKKAFICKSGNTVKKTFVCGSGHTTTKAFVCEGGDTAKKVSVREGGNTTKVFVRGSGDTTKAFICEGGDTMKGMLACGGGDVAAGSCLPMDDGTRVWGWWDNAETYVVNARL